MRITFSAAVQALKDGQLIGVPTETVYGLAASIQCQSAIKKIFKLKNRPKANPLIVHVATIEEIAKYAHSYPPQFAALAKAFWPGPLTVILPAHKGRVPAIARSGLNTVGIRIPALLVTRQLIAQTGALVMPSANLSGRPSSTLGDHLEDDFGADFPLLEGGACQNGLESTVLLYQNNKWVIGRLGALTPEVFIPVLGYEPLILEKQKTQAPACPGQSFRHYAPKAQLILGDEARINEASVILGFNERTYPDSHRLITFGSLDHPEKVAEHLYQILRQLDIEEIETA